MEPGESKLLERLESKIELTDYFFQTCRALDCFSMIAFAALEFLCHVYSSLSILAQFVQFYNAALCDHYVNLSQVKQESIATIAH